jgi:uncharacterized DUF497 family protein
MIRWNEEKNHWLIRNRGVSLETIAESILNGVYIDILENPTRKEQDIFLVQVEGYTWVVPFVMEKDDTIFLKTAFPSRKFHKLYGSGNEETD